MPPNTVWRDTGMKKWLSITLLLVLLSQVLPLNALAAIGKVLTTEELAAAYALTGLSNEAAVARNSAVYHKGMQPNATWNAMQISDWLDDVLSTEMYNVEDILTRASVALARLKESNTGAYKRLSGGDSRYKGTLDSLRKMYRDAEAVREEMRYARDYLQERANLIAEMGRQLEDQGNVMFSSERVRLSAKIETAARELNDARTEIAGKAQGWTSSIQNWNARLGLLTEGAEDGTEPGWFEELYSYEEDPVENTSRVVAVSASNTRLGKLSSGGSLLASNDSSANVFVLTENQLAIEMKQGEGKNLWPVAGVEVTVTDLRDPYAEPITQTTDEEGRIVFMSNQFVVDDDKRVLIKLDVEAEGAGYRSYGIARQKIKLGQAYVGVLAPLDDKPYIYSASFHGFDILTQKFDMLYSHLIDVDFDIEVVTRNAGNDGLTPTLRFAYFMKEGRVDIVGMFKDYKKRFVDATSRDGNTYVFRGPWKKFISPWLSKDQYPYFTFDSQDEDKSLRYYTRLVSKKGASDKPLEAGTLAFVNVMKDVFSLKFNIPGGPFPSSIKLELPIKQYLPQVTIDIGGNVNICIGSPLLRDGIKKNVLNWKNTELETLDDIQKENEKQGAVANYFAQLGVAYQFYTMKKHTILQESKLDVGLFFILSARWDLDNTIEDVKTKVITFRSGAGILLKYSYSWTIRFTLFCVPMYLSLTLAVNAGFQIGNEVAFAWVNGEFHNWSWKPIKDFTIMISVSFTAQFGVGIKGFIEAWARFVAGLEFRLHFVVNSEERSTFSGSYFLNFNVGVTLLIATYSMEFWSMGGPLFSPIPLANAAPPLQQYAYANAEPEVVEAATQEPTSYPDLVPTAREVKLSGSNQKAQIRTAVIGGQTYLFYLATVTGKDGKQHSRLYWVNAENDAIRGTTQTAIDAWASSLNAYQDYAFDVRVADGYVFLVVTSAAEFDENNLPKPNENLDVENVQCNQIFYLSVLQPDGKGNLTATLKKGYYRSGFEYGTGGVEKSLNNELVDHLLVVSQPVVYTGGHESGTNRNVYYYDSIDNPEITWAKALKKDRVSECAGIEIFGTFGRVSYAEEDDFDQVTYGKENTTYGVTSFELVPFNGSGSALIKDDPGAKCFSDQYVESGMGEDYVRTEVRGAMRCSNTEPQVHDRAVDQRYSPGFLALSEPKDGGEGDRAIEMFDFEMNGVYSDRKTVVLEKGDIEHFEMAQTAVDGDGTNYRRVVFYTEKETSDDGDVRSRLYGLYLEPIQREGRELTFDVTKYTYDLTVPAGGRFSLAYIGDVPYLYWVTTAPKENEEDLDKYRIMTSAYDISTNTMTDPAVYAEFQLPRYHYSRSVLDRATRQWSSHALDLNLLPQSVILTGTGTAYLSTVADTGAVRKYIDTTGAPELYMPKVPPVFLYSFPVQMKPVMELKDLVFADTTVCVGEFEDVTIAAMNAGNMGIANFDLELYTLEDGRANVAETIHADCLYPERSTLTMRGSVATEQLPENAQVIYRNNDFDYTARQRDWVLEQEKKQYKVTLMSGVKVDSVKTVDSDTQFIQTDMLMPGALASFAGTVKIPSYWKGDTTLYLRVKQISTYSNWARAMANAAGAKPSGIMSNAEEPEMLTWVLDEASGKMVLQTEQLSANGTAANAVRAGIIANTVDAPQDIAINVADQDIEIDHRMYGDSVGNDMLDIIISNYTATFDSFKLTCAVYLDQEEEPYYVNLPYYADGLANRHTHTITMPVTALVPDPDDHYQARVVISAVNRNESAEVNNEFTIPLGGGGLHITEQPVSQTVQEGEDVTFTVGVGGGVKPYRYQWQIWDEKHKKWVDLPGFTEATMSRKDIEKKWDGCRFRCVITDANGDQVITDEVTLRVRDRVDTGDNSNLPLYLAVALAALAVLWLVRRRIARES